MPRITLFVLLALAIPSEARATACNDEILARIAMPPGGVCWRYNGNATTFVGDFGEGQRIVAHMKGVAADSDPETGGIHLSIRNREPHAEGPGKFNASGEDGLLEFTTPEAGTYRFGFFPCSMWGAPGTVEICAR